MRVLVIGAGAREHALAWAFGRSKIISGLYIAPGNAGTAEIGTNCPDVNPMDFTSVTSLCRRLSLDLVFVGPEVPLAAGLIDYLENEKIPAIGPTSKASRLESSKVYSKDFLLKYNIQTASAVKYSSKDEFEAAVKKIEKKVVIKKNGLAAGKGVFESDSRVEILNFGNKILAEDSLLIEDYLEGYEISIFVLLDGSDYLVLPACMDYKKAEDGDTGPNTGGMGSICPVPWVDSILMDKIEKQIIVPTIAGMKSEGVIYRGILFFGLMITAEGPKVLEFNVRLGDPEAQVLLPVLNSDFGNLIEAALNQSLKTFPLRISGKSAVGVTVASPGYPHKHQKGLPVAPIPSFPPREVLIFHASTCTNSNGSLVTGGGRCFTVVGIADDTVSAINRAYEAVGNIKFPGAWYRTDIGKKFFT